MKAFRSRRSAERIWIRLGQFTLAVLLIGVAGCHQLPKGTYYPARPYLGVVTYNLRYKTDNAAQAVAFLQGFRADVVCLQEVNPEWESILRDNLVEFYPYFYLEPAGAAEGLGILSRYPLSRIRLILPGGDRLTGLGARCRSPLGEVEIINVHLTPPVTRENELKLGLLLSTPKVRLEEIQTLVSDRRGPTIVLGDFNEGASGKANEWLRKQGFANALEPYDPDTATWKWHWRFGLTFTRQIDYIYVSPQLQCAGAGVIPLEGSDHLPVYAAVVSSDR